MATAGWVRKLKSLQSCQDIGKHSYRIHTHCCQIYVDFFSPAPAQNEKIFQLEPRKYLLICKWWSLMNFRFPFYRLEHEKNKIVWIFINEAIWIFHFPPTNNLHFRLDIRDFSFFTCCWFLIQLSVYPANNL